LQNKTEALGHRLNELNEHNDEFYKSLNKTKLDDLFKCFNTSKEVEDLIFRTISKMEALKSNHEESAFIFVKLKDMLEQQEKLEKMMIENEAVLENIQTNVGENNKSIRKNIDLLRERLNKLK
jgi:hypothetical protein